MSDKRQEGDQRPLVTTTSSRTSFGSIILTPFRRIYERCKNLKKPSAIKGVRWFFTSFSLKKDHERSQEPEEKPLTYRDASMTGDDAAHQGAENAHEGLSRGKRPRDIGDAETFMDHHQPPPKILRIDQDSPTASLKGKASEELDTPPPAKKLKTEARCDQPTASLKRKASEEPDTPPPAKKLKTEAKCDQSGEDEGPSQEEPNTCTPQNTKGLSPDHMSVLQSEGYDGMLDDEIINMAQDLLQRQFPDSDGLQPVAAILFPGYEVTKHAVQIHNDWDRLHWITTSYRNGKIMVADSMSTQNLSPSIRDQITNIYSGVVHEPLNHLHFLDVDQQKNGYDCGVFAIAFAYELLAEDGDPEVTFDHAAIRGHLINCLQSGRITKFPRKEKITIETTTGTTTQ